MATTHPALEPFLARQALVTPPQPGEAGLVRCQQTSDALDAALSVLATEGTANFAVVAVGGYGRREQCRHSDVDLMLLVQRGDEEAATHLLYPLWDAGLKVGHSVRTLGDIPDAVDNIETFTALLDARLVTGDAALFEQLEGSVAKLARSRLVSLTEGLRERHQALQRAEPWELQATDVKANRGGLRHLQLIHWFARASQLADHADGLTLAPALEDARERLLAVRQGVHALAERPTDQFRDDLAPRVAEWLGEETMQTGRALYGAMREVDRAATATFTSIPPKRRWWQRRDGGDDPATPPSEAPTTDLDALRAALRRAADDTLDPALDPLPKADWLDRLVPEWETVRARRHIAPFHTHPVDTHALRTVAEAAYIAEHDEDDARTIEVMQQFGDLDELLLAAFLHDVGKGSTLR